jgi:pimeloyl-ACP methyl ester carboxylesterase
MKLSEKVSARDSRVFQAMDRDVAAAYLWLATQPGADLTRFVLVGASVGCSVALDYAAHDRSVDAVVCLTPGTNYLGINSIRDAEKYGNRPVLLLASEPERKASAELSRILKGAQLVVVPGPPAADPTALHGTRMFGKVPGIEHRITAFLTKAVGPPAAEPVVASIHSDVFHDPSSSTVRRIKRENLRWFSSPAEATARGLRPPKSRARKRGPS